MGDWNVEGHFVSAETAAEALDWARRFYDADLVSVREWTATDQAWLDQINPDD